MSAVAGDVALPRSGSRWRRRTARWEEAREGFARGVGVQLDMA
jgi:hypothetical protein